MLDEWEVSADQSVNYINFYQQENYFYKKNRQILTLSDAKSSTCGGHKRISTKWMEICFL